MQQLFQKPPLHKKQEQEPEQMDAETALYQYDQACKLIDQGIQLYQKKQFPMAKIILVNQSQILVKVLKAKAIPLEESTRAQQYLTKGLKHAEDCNAQITILQNSVSQGNPYAKVIIDNSLIRKCDVSFEQIAGLEATKQMLNETIILPNMRPDLFTGIRSPHKGILFYGPPGNGKTLLAKAVASQAKCCFFNMSASSLVQKNLGEGEKIMKALFQTAQFFQPCVIFIDEIDSILSARGENEHEASRRLKTEFLVNFDGVQSSDQDKVIFIGATNRPQDMDDAVLRRFTLKVLIDQPDFPSRLAMLKMHLKDVTHDLDEKSLKLLAEQLKGYSASDIKAVVKEACMCPLRSEIKNAMILSVSKNDIRPVKQADFTKAMTQIQPTLSQKQLQEYLQFDKKSRK